MKVDILAIGVHPDDIEISCCGTLLHHIHLGKKVGLLDLTRGELGTRGNAEIRLQEATIASELIGAKIRKNLGLSDGFFKNNKENMLKVVEIIRLMQPEIVLTNAVSDRHPDHGRASKLTSEACFYSGLRKIQTTWDKVPQKAWRPRAVYHYIQDQYLKPDFVVNISPYIDKKIEIIKSYKSQFFDPESTEPETPISGKIFLDFIRGKNAVQGRPASFDYGEGFTVDRTIGINNLFDIK